jgi:hypothetical protein
MLDGEGNEDGHSTETITDDVDVDDGIVGDVEMPDVVVNDGSSMD